MHVAIDAVGNRTGGGWAVLTRTIAEVAGDPRITALTVFCSPLRMAPTSPPEHPHVRYVERPIEHRPTARVAWYTHGLDAEVARVGADVALLMNGAGRTRAPTVALIQQALLLTDALGAVRPRAFGARLAALRALARPSVAAARRVIVQTTWMRARVWETLGRDAVVLPLGLPRPRPRAATSRAETLVALVGTELPYKRRDIAFGALAIARQRHPALELTSVIDAPPATVSALLDRASVLMQPSEVESLGLPVVEALAAGCPAIVPRLPWAEAIAADAALYFDAGSPSSAARRLVETQTVNGLLDEVRARGFARIRALWDAEPYRGLVDVLEESL